MATKAYDESDQDLVEQNAHDRAERGFFGRIILFFHQVVAELRKVITPTRNELVNFTLVVLAFVVIVMGIIFGLDTLFGLLMSWAFGG